MGIHDSFCSAFFLMLMTAVLSDAIPDECVSRWCIVIVFPGCPIFRGRYLFTGSLRLIFPSSTSFIIAKAVRDFVHEPTP